MSKENLTPNNNTSFDIYMHSKTDEAGYVSPREFTYNSVDANRLKATPLQEDFLDELTRQVVDSFADTPNERLRYILQTLVRGIHSLVRELNLTSAELASTIAFLTEVGKTCTSTRQEFILLSDVLGVSMLVELINESLNGRTKVEESENSIPVTEPTVLGPFHMTQSPKRSSGETISAIGDSMPLYVRGKVRSSEGKLIAGAHVDVWQCNSDGFYDVQQPDIQPAGNGRGIFTTDDYGSFHFLTVVPSHYPIPTDGPVGKLIELTRRHPYRPAHIHFLVQAHDYMPLVTHIFMPNSQYLDSDAVFAVRPSLICRLEIVDNPSKSEQLGLIGKFAYTEIDLVVRAANMTGTDLSSEPSK